MYKIEEYILPASNIKFRGQNIELYPDVFTFQVPMESDYKLTVFNRRNKENLGTEVELNFHFNFGHKNLKELLNTEIWNRFKELQLTGESIIHEIISKGN